MTPLGHHAGEQALLIALAGGGTVAAGMLVVLRATLDRVVRWLSRR